MNIGGFNIKKHTDKDIAYVPYTPDSQYVIKIHGLKIGGIDTSLNVADFSKK